MNEIVYVAAGSNQGDRAAYLAQARQALAALPQVHVLAVSRVEETEHVGPTPQPAYLNQMIAISTSLEPLALLDALQAIERAAGRVRRERWGPRTLDLDIVEFGNRTVHHARLRVPHPELSNRPFWQRELAAVRQLVEKERQ